MRPARFALVFVASALAGPLGCSQAHPSEDVAPGIYELRVESETEACSPARAVGDMGSVAVLVREGAIDAPIPERDDTALTAPRVLLEPASSFHSETNRRVPGCDVAWVHEEWTVLGSRGSSFEVLSSQEWTGLASCRDARGRMPDAPETDCVSERRLSYGLTEVCAAPCRLLLGEAAAVRCSCE